ncbi:hypothetical protein [Rhizobium leguminosarum]|nr:hypothetical protein [Rhizobium leguminosarum]
MKISAPKNGETQIVPVGLFLAFQNLVTRVFTAIVGTTPGNWQRNA